MFAYVQRTDVLQRQRPDADKDPDYRRSDAGVGTNPRRGRRNARWLLHSGDRRFEEPMSSCSDRTQSGTIRTVWGRRF